MHRPKKQTRSKSKQQIQIDFTKILQEEYRSFLQNLETALTELSKEEIQTLDEIQRAQKRADNSFEILGTYVDQWFQKIKVKTENFKNRFKRHVWENNETWSTVANELMNAIFEIPEYDPDIVRKHIPVFRDAYIYLQRIVDQNLPNFTNVVLIAENQYKKLFRAIPTLSKGKETHFITHYFEAMKAIDPRLSKLSPKRLWFVSSVYYPAKIAPVLIISLLPEFTDYANLYVIGFYVTLAKLFASKFRQNVRYVDKNLWTKALQLVSSSSKLKQFQFDYVLMFRTIAQQMVYSWYLRKIAEGKVKVLKDVHIELYNKATVHARTLITAYYKVYEAYKTGKLSGLLLTGDKAEEEQKEKEFTLQDIPNTIQTQVQQALTDFTLELEPDADVIEYLWLHYVERNVAKNTLTEVARLLHDTTISKDLETIVATIVVKSGLTILSRTYREKLIQTALDLLNAKDVTTLPFRRSVDKLYKYVVDSLNLQVQNKQTESLIKRFIVTYITTWIVEHI